MALVFNCPTHVLKRRPTNHLLKFFSSRQNIRPERLHIDDFQAGTLDGFALIDLNGDSRLTARMSQNMLKCSSMSFHAKSSGLRCSRLQRLINNFAFAERASLMKSEKCRGVSSTRPVKPADYHSSPQMDDDIELQHLLNAAKEGVTDAVGELLSGLRSYLKIVAETALKTRSLALQNSSDLVQIAQFDAAQQFSRFRGANHLEFRAWVRQILLNKIVDAQRVAIREGKSLSKLDPAIWGSMLLSVGECLADDPSPSSLVARNEQELHLQSTLKLLPSRYQEIIKRHHFGRETFEEISLDWNCSEDAVRKLWTRALVKMREKMRPVS